MIFIIDTKRDNAWKVTDNTQVSANIERRITLAECDEIMVVAMACPKHNDAEVGEQVVQKKGSE